MHIQELARHLNAEIDPGLALEIQGVASLEEASASDITFLGNPKYLRQLQTCQAGAILVSSQFSDALPMPALRVENPYLAFAQAIELFHRKPRLPLGIHPTAVLGEGVVLGQNVTIAAYVVIGNQVHIGDQVTIHPHCVIYDGAVIGSGSILHSHVVVRETVRIGERVVLQNGVVIGADGYGFVTLKDGSHYKILQAGTVVLDDDVEVQAQSTIDRATIGTTRVGHGTKIDNLVQVGHGSTIGKHSLICAQVGLAGSTKVGNHVILAGQVGAAGHLEIGDRAIASAQTGIHNDVEPGAIISGYPGIPNKLWLKSVAIFNRLPEMYQSLKQLQRRLGDK
jgi:UDP-3-O-[3-hydroxymyristoyl] glucosamine N-acyltransferase